VLTLREPSLDIDLPQIVVESRADDLIDLSSLVWLTERSLWQAFGVLDLPYTEWVARKEIWQHEGPVVHLYIENGHEPGGRLETLLHEALIETMDDYRTYAGMMKRNPVKVTELNPGTFRGYMEQKRAEGAELGHLKPPRMQPREAVVQQLRRISGLPAEPGDVTRA
jgi:hypothetical protein